MATKWAIATGNWSNTSTWNGGTLPGDTDDVFADGRTVTIDQNIKVGTLNTYQRVGGTTGGQFRVTVSGIYVTASQIVGGSSNCLYVTSAAQNVNIYGNSTHQGAVNYVYAISVDSNSMVNLYGTVSAGTKSTGSSDYTGLYVLNSTVNMTGNVIGSATGSYGYGALILSSNFNLIGNIIAGSGSGAGVNHGLYTTGLSYITMTGSVVGYNASIGLYSNNSTGQISIWGNITGFGGWGVQNISGSSIFNVYGNINGSTTGGYYGTGGSLISNGVISGGLANASYGVYINGASMSHTGTIYGGISNTSYGVLLNNATSTITGNLIGGTGGSSTTDSAYALSSQSSTTLTINGTVSAGPRAAIYSTSILPTTITGSIISSTSSRAIFHGGLGSLTINGNQSAKNSNWAIERSNNSGNFTLNGDIMGDTTGTDSRFLYDYSVGKTITINGSLIQQNITTLYGLIYHVGTSVLNITGTVSGGSTSGSVGVISNAANITNITGNVTGNLAQGVNLAFTGASVSVTGDVIAGSYPAITSVVGSKAIVTGNLVNNSDFMAYYGYNLIVGNSNNFNWTVQGASGSNRLLSSTSSSIGVPTMSNVRSGIVYGTSGEFTGTLAVPTASSVSYGVPVDNTTGTAILNVKDVGTLLAGFIV